LTQFAGLADRLDFLLPGFTRVSWVNDSARQTWEPRFRRIRDCWREIEWRSAADGVRQGALLPVGTRLAMDIAARPPVGVTTELLDPVKPIASRYECPTNLSSTRERGWFGLGKPDHVCQLRDAVAGENHDEIGRLLGYPDCCRQAFIHVRIELEMADATWAMVLGASTESLNHPLETNIFWRQLGIRLVPHLPCSLACPQSLQLAAAMSEVGHRHGFAAPLAWLREILSWPLEWSALHGIAEIKTPVLRLSTSTDATASKYTFSWRCHGRAPNGALTQLIALA